MQAGSFSILLPYCDPAKGPGINLKTLDLWKYELYKPLFFIKYLASGILLEQQKAD